MENYTKWRGTHFKWRSAYLKIENYTFDGDLLQIKYSAKRQKTYQDVWPVCRREQGI